MPNNAIPISDYAIVAVISYLLGSIPFGYLLVKTFTGADVRTQGSGNIGATNVARTGKKGLAIATLVLDALKGYAAVIIAVMLTPGWLTAIGSEVSRPPNSPLPSGGTSAIEFTFMALAALFAVIGHMYPVWLKFKGGKGVATALGVYIALAPKAIVVSIVVFFLVLALTKYVSLGSVLSSAVFPVSFWFLDRREAGSAVLLMICAIQVLIIWKHADNIRRLAAGTESKFGAKKAGV